MAVVVPDALAAALAKANAMPDVSPVLASIKLGLLSIASSLPSSDFLDPAHTAFLGKPEWLLDPALMKFNSTVDGEGQPFGPFERWDDGRSEKAERGEPTVLEVVPPIECCGPRLSRLLARVLERSLGEGVRLAGEVRGELRGLHDKKRNSVEERQKRISV